MGALRGQNGSNEELGAVGVGSGVGHGQGARLGVLELEVLILELVAIDCRAERLINCALARRLHTQRARETLTGLSTSAIALGEVAALDHEVLDHTVEGRALVAEALLASGEGAEVLSRLGNSLSVEANDNAADGLVAVLDVKEDLVGDLGALAGLSSLGEEDQPDSEEQGGGNKKPPKVEHGG